jgi:hypothetical protein
MAYSDRAGTFRAPEEARRIHFAANRADAVVCGNEGSAVPAGMFEARHKDHLKNRPQAAGGVILRVYWKDPFMSIRTGGLRSFFPHLRIQA